MSEIKNKLNSLKLKDTNGNFSVSADLLVEVLVYNRKLIDKSLLGCFTTGK